MMASASSFSRVGGVYSRTFGAFCGVAGLRLDGVLILGSDDS